jgi:hypothetical protein
MRWIPHMALGGLLMGCGAAPRDAGSSPAPRAASDSAAATAEVDTSLGGPTSPTTPTTPLDSGGAGPTTPSTQPVDTSESGDSGSTTTPFPDPAACVVPMLDDLFSGWAPPNPFDAWEPAPPCAIAPHDTFIVLGCPSNEDGSPSSCQRGRIDTVMELYESGYGEHFIVTGGAV